MTASVEVSGLSVQFPLYHGNARSLKKTMFAAASGRLGRDRQHRVVVEALRDVSFSLRSGDRLGLIGGNGAGKTTLLRAIAGIYEPVAGRVRVEGVLGALLDPGMGMNAELTGRENIRMRGLYDGLTRAQTARIEQDVVDFAELAEFIDLPVRFYSAGMTVRLGFALATAMPCQVLLMDEWLMAGDAAFMGKARARIESLVLGADILVLSSHAPDIVRQWCGRALWMDQGRVIEDGPPDDVIAAYLGLAPVDAGTAFATAEAVT